MRGVPILPLGLLILALTANGASAAQASASEAREAYARAIELQSHGDESGALALLWYAAGANPRDPDIQNGLAIKIEFQFRGHAG